MKICLLLEKPIAKRTDFLQLNAAVNLALIIRLDEGGLPLNYGTSAPLSQLLGMPKPSEQQIELLRTIYAAFNSRNIDAALAAMTAEVAWPKAFKGGFVRGPEEIRAYWTEQWSEIDPNVEPVAFYSEPDGRITLDVHQVVRDLKGTVLADEHTGHSYTFKDGLISKMEIAPVPVAN